MGPAGDGDRSIANDAMRRGDANEMRRVLAGRPDLLRGSDGRDPWLWQAAKLGNLVIVQALVELGIDVNEPATGGLHYAIESAASAGHVNVVRWLLDHGAIINREIDGKPRCNALSRAAREGHLEVAKLLVERGAYYHAAWGVTNILMEAEFAGHSKVAEYLRSLGAKDLREITPPDYPAAHEKIIKHMLKRGPLGTWTAQVPDHSVAIHVIPRNPKDPEESTVFTVGLSDRFLPAADDRFASIELRLLLPASWPVEDPELSRAEWSGPIDWLKRIGTLLRGMTVLPQTPAIFPQDAQDQPLWSGTRLSAWLCLQSMSESISVPDFRWISIFGLFPIFPEEVELVRKEGHEALLERFEEHGIPLCVDPVRPCVA